KRTLEKYCRHVKASTRSSAYSLTMKDNSIGQIEEKKAKNKQVRILSNNLGMSDHRNKLFGKFSNIISQQLGLLHCGKMTAFRHFIPLLNIEKLICEVFRRQKVGAELRNGSRYFCSCSFHIERIYFFQWIKHFLHQGLHCFIISAKRRINGLCCPID